jgi:predicted GH43/DUF377 family glycosyl hydrolase
MKVRKEDLKLYANPAAVITQFLQLPGEDRITNIIRRAKQLGDDEVNSLLEKLTKEFGWRHRNLDSIFLDHFSRIYKQFENDLLLFSHRRKLLLGAYFTKEYSIQAAALFNPSIVPHPDQKNLQQGEQRFVMSLRATGEGHISSIVFHTGVADTCAKIRLDASSAYFTPLRKNAEAIYTKDFIKKRAAFFNGFKMEVIDFCPEQFTASEAIYIISKIADEKSAHQFKEIIDTNYELESSTNLAINEKVIFPKANAESMGMEDVRFVKFSYGENHCYYGTYSAYDGHQIKTQLIETKDFDIFKIRTLYGNAITDKGMALFPEKVNGKFVMISRQGGEKINIMFSDDLYVWNEFQTLMEPLHTWELVQLGNCGSPLKTDKGWLLLTHGVGAMRTYVISAVLLDLKDPSIIVGRLSKPILEADEEEREGYVPNVVYSCGLLLHGDVLIIPYAVSDSATCFVTMELNEILNELTQNKLP